jgi:c-di-GMP-related signal transduction protein
MKKTYIARQAVLDTNLKTIGYELFLETVLKINSLKLIKILPALN